MKEYPLKSLAFPGATLVDHAGDFPSDGWFIYRAVGTKIEYLHPSGAWADCCSHCWFSSRTAAMKVFSTAAKEIP